MVEVGEVTICQKSLDATSASEKQFFHGILVSTIQDFPGFKIDGYTRIGQTFQHHHIQINTSASVCMRLHEESASQCNGLFTEGGKVLTGRFHYRILFDHHTEKRNTEAKALILYLFHNCYKIICYAMSLHSSFSGFQMKVVSE